MIGMDITPEMLEQGHKKLARLGLQENIELRMGDAEHIDLPDNSVDGCCSAFTARNLTDLKQGFREMLRVVRPGGRVVCLEISHPPGKIFGTLFHFYFYKLAPLFGTIIGKAFEEYNYLPHSLTHFPNAAKLQEIMEEVGWSDVHFYRLSGGIVAIHVGTKSVGKNGIKVEVTERSLTSFHRNSVAYLKLRTSTATRNKQTRIATNQSA